MLLQCGETLKFSIWQWLVQIYSQAKPGDSFSKKFCEWLKFEHPCSTWSHETSVDCLTSITLFNLIKPDYIREQGC